MRGCNCVDDLAESYRIMLGLKTWEDQEKYAQIRHGSRDRQHGSSDPKRRSGRTTRGLLRAIAQATLDSVQTIVVDAKPSANMQECLNTGRQLLAGLGLDRCMRLVPDRHRVADQDSKVGYIDHAMGDRR